jgi:hypothetical protein
MRGIFLLMAATAGICVALYYPFAGVLLWTWFSVMSPRSPVSQRQLDDS